jgi:hypothetical protein
MEKTVLWTLLPLNFSLGDSTLAYWRERDIRILCKVPLVATGGLAIFATSGQRERQGYLGGRQRRLASIHDPEETHLKHR